MGQHHVVRLALAAALGSALHDDSITVGSFDFAESTVVAEVYSQALEAHGYHVVRAFGLGPREFVAPALALGLIEFVPEYAGTATTFLSLGASIPGDDVAETHDQLVRTLGDARVTALAPAPAQDVNAFVVTRSTADRLGLHTVTDLAPYASDLSFGGPKECPTRPLCLRGLHDRYGLDFSQFIALDAGGPVTRQALRSGAVDVGLLFSTDPAIDGESLVELQDDGGLQPSENVTPLVRTEIIDRWSPAIAATIDAVSEHLTTAAVRSLNEAMTIEHPDVATIAADWLRAQGLI